MEKNLVFQRKKKQKRDGKKIPCLSHYNNVTAHEIDSFTAAVLPHMHAHWALFGQ